MTRTTVQSRLHKLGQSGVIQGYSIELRRQYHEYQVAAHVSIKDRQKLTTQTNNALKQINNITALYDISGEVLF